MKNNSINIQDIILNNARKEKMLVSMYLVNGIQIKGIVKGFDNYVILIEDDKKQQSMIYKHAVSTLLPSKYINLQSNNQK